LQKKSHHIFLQKREKKNVKKEKIPRVHAGGLAGVSNYVVRWTVGGSSLLGL
jgi:hypothetical protein